MLAEQLQKGLVYPLNECSTLTMREDHTASKVASARSWLHELQSIIRQFDSNLTRNDGKPATLEYLERRVSLAAIPVPSILSKPPEELQTA